MNFLGMKANTERRKKGRTSDESGLKETISSKESSGKVDSPIEVIDSKYQCFGRDLSIWNLNGGEME